MANTPSVLASTLMEMPVFLPQLLDADITIVQFGADFWPRATSSNENNGKTCCRKQGGPEQFTSSPRMARHEDGVQTGSRTPSDRAYILATCA